MANPYTNLYVWFSNGTERRRFVMELLQLKPEVPKRKGKRAAAEARERQRQLDAYLDMMGREKPKAPITPSPTFFTGAVCLRISISMPFPPGMKPGYFRGFRFHPEILYRRRHWLVIQFSTPRARKAKLGTGADPRGEAWDQRLHPPGDSGPEDTGLGRRPPPKV